MKAVVKI